MPTSILDRLGSRQGKRSDLPNQALARELAAGKDRKAIREVAQIQHLRTCRPQPVAEHAEAVLAAVDGSPTELFNR